MDSVLIAGVGTMKMEYPEMTHPICQFQQNKHNRLSEMKSRWTFEKSYSNYKIIFDRK